jgi:hypothetical protein
MSSAAEQRLPQPRPIMAHLLVLPRRAPCAATSLSHHVTGAELTEEVALGGPLGEPLERE